MKEATDDRLIEKTLAGNHEAFAQLVARHKRKVFRLVARFARNNAELDDICQEVFIKAFENLRSFLRSAPFEHWLAKITVRTCYDALRRRRTNDTQPLTYEVRDHSIEERKAAEEASKLLEWGMSKLRQDERLVITLLELEEKHVREIAELTGWSESNVKVKAHRARQALKRILEERDE